MGPDPNRLENLAKRALGWSAGGTVRPWLILVLLSLAFFLPGQMTIPPLDRDEARFVQASKQMMETGDYVDIRFQDAPRYKKPVGIYWLQTAAANALSYGDAAPIWVYRIPSLIGAIGAVLATFWAGQAFFARHIAVLGAAMVAASLLPGVEAHLAKTDAALLATIVAAQGCLARAYLDRAIKTSMFPVALLFWVAMAAGVLIKGPLILLVTGLTIVALWLADRRIGWLNLLAPLWGVPLMLALVLPWFAAIFLKTDGAFFTASIGHDLLSKAVGGQESHGAPPGTYILLLGLLLWPFAPPLVLAVPKIWHERNSVAQKFLVSWAIPVWITFEIFPTKLPHYILPVLPALALLTARAIIDGLPAARAGWRHLVAWWLLLLCAGLPLGLAGASTWLTGSIDALALAGLGFAVIAALAAFRNIRSGRHFASLLAVIICAGLTLVTGFGRVMPGLQPIWLSDRMVTSVRTHAACGEPEIASVGFEEPSLVFLGGTETLLADAKKGAGFLAEGGCRMVFVADVFKNDFIAASSARALNVTMVDTISGYNISKGRFITMRLFRAD